jgi:pimeloyl-ACP methyl ester carboxylesterase
LRFLVGHSQGALIAEIIGESEDVESVVSLSGTVQPIDKVLKEQFKQLDAVSYEEAIKILDQIKIGQYDFEVPAELETFFGGDNAFLHSWMSYNPMDYMPVIEGKLLFIYGDRDSQVSSDETEILRSDYRYHIVKDMNHVLKKVESDFENKDSYIHPIYEVHEDLVDILVELVLK